MSRTPPCLCDDGWRYYCGLHGFPDPAYDEDEEETE